MASALARGMRGNRLERAVGHRSWDRRASSASGTLVTSAGRNGPRTALPSLRVVVVDRKDAVLRAGKAGVGHLFAARRRLDGARLADGGHARAEAVLERADVVADLLAGDRFGEKKAVRRKDAQRDAEKRMERSQHVAQRVAIDEILEADVGTQREGLQLVIVRYARGVGLAHELARARCWSNRRPPSADAKQLLDGDFGAELLGDVVETALCR